MNKKEQLERKLDATQYLYKALSLASRDWTVPACIFTSVVRVSTSGYSRCISLYVACHDKETDTIRPWYLTACIATINDDTYIPDIEAVRVTGYGKDVILSTLYRAFHNLANMDNYKDNNAMCKWIDNQSNWQYTIL